MFRDIIRMIYVCWVPIGVCQWQLNIYLDKDNNIIFVDNNKKILMKYKIFLNFKHFPCLFFIINCFIFTKKSTFFPITKKIEKRPPRRTNYIRNPFRQYPTLENRIEISGRNVVYKRKTSIVKLIHNKKKNLSRRISLRSSITHLW